MGTLEQLRAKHAWEQIQRVIDNSQEWPKFVTNTKQMPARIVNAGLGQAVAFVQAKGEAPALIMALEDWLLRRFPQAPRVNQGEQSQRREPGQNQPSSSGPGARLMQAIQASDATTYRLMTDEAMAYLQWLKRFAEAQSKG